MEDKITTPGETGSSKSRLVDLLLQEKLVNAQQIAEALDLQKKEHGGLDAALIRLGHLDPDAFYACISKQRGVPSIELDNYSLAEDITHFLPRELAVKYEVIPIDKLRNLLTIAMACPLDDPVLESISKTTQLKVKAVLCSADDIRAAIKRYYPEEQTPVPTESAAKESEEVSSGIKLRNVADIINKIDALPALPDTVRNVKSLIDDDSSSIRDVSEAISKDPPLSARLLKLANSAAYGFPNRVDSVSMAATLLGLRETYNIVLSSAVLDLIAGAENFDYDIFMEDSVFCASASKGLAEARGMKRASAVSTAGLLHDLGRYALAQAASRKYGEMTANQSGRALVAAEEQHFGIAHPEVGYLLATNWRLPEQFAQAIRFHHAPETAPQPDEFIYVVAFAAYMTEANRRGIGAEALVERGITIIEALELNGEQAMAIYEAAQGKAGHEEEIE